MLSPAHPRSNHLWIIYFLPLNLVPVSCNLLEVAPESVFSDPALPPPHPPAVSACVWFVVLDSCPEDYSLPENKAPQCVLCFPHSLALTSAVWQEGGGLQRLCAVRDPSLPKPTSTLTRQSGWRTLAEWGAPPAISYQHKHPPLPVPNKAIKGMLYIPHVVLRHILDRDAG